jgi:hypothetical protein
MRLYLKGSDITNINYNINQYQIKPSQSTNTIYGTSNLQNSQYTFNLNLMNVLGSDYRNKDKFNIKVLDVRNINENVITTGTSYTPITVVNNNWRSVAYSPSLKRFVAVATSGSNNRVMYSNDNGLTWTNITNTSINFVWMWIIWNSSLNQFVAVNSNASNSVMYSTDGITWTINATSTIVGDWRCLTYSSSLNRYVAVSADNKIMTCDGNASGTWTLRTSPNTNFYYNVAWSNTLNLFAACSTGASLNSIITSSNGINWTIRTTPNNSNLKSITWSPSRNEFYCIADSGDRSMSSKNGINWTSYNTLPLETYTNVFWLDDIKLYIALSSSGTQRVKTSLDGITWNGIDTSAVSFWGCATNNLGNIVIVGGQSSTILEKVLISNTSQNIIDYSSPPHLRTSNIFIKGLNFCNNKSENLLGYFTNINPNEELSIDVVIRYNMGNFTMFIRSNTDNVLGYQSYDFVDIFFDKALSHLSSYPQRLIFKNTYNQAILNILDNKIFTIKEFTFDNSNYILTCVFEDPTVPASYIDVLNGNYPITIQTLPLINQWYYVNRNDKHNNPDNSNLELSAYINKQNPYINLTLELRDVMTDTLQPVITEINNKVYPNLEFILDVN